MKQSLLLLIIIISYPIYRLRCINSLITTYCTTKIFTYYIKIDSNDDNYHMHQQLYVCNYLLK